MRPSVLAFFVALAPIAPALSAPPPPPVPAEAYQFTVVKGTTAYGQVIVRVATATGQSVLCVGSSACVPVADAQPTGPGEYRVSSWEVIDAVGSQRNWNVTRFDLRSGRMWLIAYDGKVTASWTETK